MPTNEIVFASRAMKILQIMLSPEERRQETTFASPIALRFALQRSENSCGMDWSHGMNAKPNVHEKSKNFEVLKPGRGD